MLTLSGQLHSPGHVLSKGSCDTRLWGGALPLRKEWRFHWKSTSEKTDRSGLYAGTFLPGTFWT